MKLKVQVAKLDSLIPHPRNSRQGDVGVITQSLEAHGQYKPLLVQLSTSYVIAGNHTLRAMHALGWKQAEVICLDVDDDEALRILLVDNRSSDLATNDDAGLSAVLAEFSKSDKGFLGTGYDGDDLGDLLFLLDKGGAGSITDALSATERSQLYENSGIKSFVLPYPASGYEELSGMMKSLREKMKIETNSELVERLVREAMKR